MIILGSIWVYALFGIAFTYVPSDYQWLLGLVTPLPKVVTTRVLLYACYKSAGPGKEGKYSIKYPCINALQTKHVVFCSVIIGSIATQFTIYCILGMRCIMSVYKCWQATKSRNSEGVFCPEVASKCLSLYKSNKNTIRNAYHLQTTKLKKLLLMKGLKESFQ